MTKNAVEDRLDVMELAARYAQAIDRKDWDAVADVFAEKLDHDRGYMSRAAYEQGRPDFTAASRDEAVHFQRVFVNALQQTHHMVGNHVTEIAGDSATLSFYVRAHHQGTGDKSDLFEE